MILMNEKTFVVLVLAPFVLISVYFALSASLVPDEGTHLLLGIFYRDLVTNLSSFSYEEAWQYGLNYLLHYPKLQIAYPPLYHFLLSVFFFFIESELVGRFLSIFFYASSGVLVYLITKKFFSRGGAVLSMAAYLSYFFVFSTSFLALQDNLTYFFVLLSFYLFLEFSKNGGTRDFFVLGIVSSLAALAKQMGGVIVLIYTILLLFQKRPFKNILAMFTGFCVLILPYLFILSSIGGIEINKYQGFFYAYSQGEPTNYFDIWLWIWYLVEPSTIYPPLLILLTLFALYVKDKKPGWKELLVFSVVFYLGLSVILNKEPRFSTFFSIPFFIAFGKVFERRKYAAILVVLFFAFSLAALHTERFPTDKIVSLFEKEGNIAYLGEGGNNHLPFSSVIMWKTRVADEEMSRYHFRGCNFNNVSDITEELKKKGIKYLVVYPNSPVDISSISGKLKKIGTFESEGSTLEVYEYLDYVKSEEFCNKICLTGWEVCRKNGTVNLIK